jgi:hypothetical protein
LLFQGVGGENVEEQLRVLSNLRQHFTGFSPSTTPRAHNLTRESEFVIDNLLVRIQPP